MSPPDQDPQGNEDLYSQRELAEIDELNRLAEPNRSFLQSQWWKRLAVGFSIVIALSLLLPIILQARTGSGNSGTVSSRPSSASALPLPDFELVSAQGAPVTLSGVFDSHSLAVLVFYRGYF